MKILCTDDQTEVFETLKELEDDWDRILCGPYADEDEEPDIDSVFAKNWKDAIEDWAYDVGIDYEGMSTEDIETALAQRVSAEDAVAETSGGVLIAPLKDKGGDPTDVGAFKVDGDKVEFLGAFLGQHLGVHPDHQGNEIGTALVVGILLTNGEIPTWNLDTASYSPGGSETVYGGATFLLSLLEEKYESAPTP